MICRRGAVVTSAGAVAALAAAGCGSTVHNVDAAGAAGSTSGLAVAPGSTAMRDPGSPGEPSGASAAGVAGNGPGIPPAGGVLGPAVAGGGAGTAAQGVGVTPKAIYVGITYQTNGDAANQALGASSITQGDTKADAQAVVDDVNAHGGVAGRKLVPVWYNYDTTDSRPYTVQDNAACAQFTQDHRVFAVLGNGLTDNYVACNTKAGAVDVNGQTIIGPDNAFFRRFPYYFDYGTLSQDRMMADEGAVLSRLGYFAAWDFTTGRAGSLPVKVGIIGYDTSSWTTPLRTVLLPNLARAGHAVRGDDVRLITYPSDNSQIGPAVAQIQSAVLKFRQDAVTHVIVLDANGSMMLQLMQNARGQHYYPRYGVNTATGMQALAGTGAVDPKQFNGAVGLGWSPTLDLPAGTGDRYLGRATTYCIKTVEKRTGQHFTSTNAAAIAISYCDGLYLLRDAVNRAGSVLNQQTSRVAIEDLGSRFHPAGMAASYFSPSRHDALEVGYDMRWDSACSCSKYVGEHRIP